MGSRNGGFSVGGNTMRDALAGVALLVAVTGIATAQDRTPAPSGPTVRAGPPAAGAPLIAAVPDAARGPERPAAGLLSGQAEGELLSSDLVGRALYDRGGRKLGEITDILVDRNRRLSAVVATFDLGSEIRGKSVGIPFDALQRSSADRQDVRLIVDIDEASLRGAKAFEPLSHEASQDDNQDLTAKGGAATGGSVPPPAR
jgi:sporulation protein YlmC with PRC-barrel domain